MENEKPDTWTITVEFTVFAGDMDEQDVIRNAKPVLEYATDGTDLAGYSIISVKRDEL